MTDELLEKMIASYESLIKTFREYGLSNIANKSEENLKELKKK